MCAETEEIFSGDLVQVSWTILPVVLAIENMSSARRRSRIWASRILAENVICNMDGRRDEDVQGRAV